MTLKNKLVVFGVMVLSAFLWACGSSKEEHKMIGAPRLELYWQTDTLLTTCESALYDADAGVIYVSNINQNPWGIDSNGFIAKLDTTGKITDLKWATGVSGPKGMGISNGKLYVNDIDRMVAFDLETAQFVEAYPVAGKSDLNDISVSATGEVFSSGSASAAVYHLKDGVFKVYKETGYDRLNGLCAQEEGLYFVTSKDQYFGVIKPDLSVEILTEGIGQGDGLIRLSNGDFISSAWNGEIYHIAAKDWKKTLLLDTKKMGMNTADIEYIPESNLLLVPTFFKNRLKAYKLIWDKQ